MRLFLLNCFLLIARAFPLAAEDVREFPIPFQSERIELGCNRFNDKIQDEEKFLRCVEWQTESYDELTKIWEAIDVEEKEFSAMYYLCSRNAPEDSFWFNVNACIKNTIIKYDSDKIGQDCLYEASPLAEFSEIQLCYYRKSIEVNQKRLQNAQEGRLWTVIPR